MAVNNIATAIRNAMCDAFVDAIDDGAGAGLFEVFTAAFAAKLGTMTFADPAFGAAAAGVATAGAIVSDTSADATGTLAVLRVTDSVPVTKFEGTIGTSGQDYNVNTLSVTAGDTIACTAFTVTMPAS